MTTKKSEDFTFITGRLALALLRKKLGEHFLPLYFESVCPKCGERVPHGCWPEENDDGWRGEIDDFLELMKPGEPVYEVVRRGGTSNVVKFLDKIVKEVLAEGLRRAREAHHGGPQSRKEFEKRVRELLREELQRDPSVNVRDRDEKVGQMLKRSGKTVQRVRLGKKVRGE